jgi:hypothetical protein
MPLMLYVFMSCLRCYLIFHQEDLFIGLAEQKLVAVIREVTNQL